MEKKFNRRKMLGGTVGAVGLAGGVRLLGTPVPSADRSIPGAHEAGVMSTAGDVIPLNFWNTLITAR